MAIIQLPESIYTGIDSINHIFDKENKKILIISSVDIENATNILPSVLQKAEKHGVNADLMVSDNPSEIFSAIEEKLLTETPEIIVAVGDGKIIDCIMTVSSVSGIPYYAVPQVAPTVLWETDRAEAFVTRKIPLVCILDPEAITRSNSVKIAYEGLGMLAICAESFLYANDRYIKLVAKTAFVQILNNLFDAFKGEISARENLLEGMYGAYIAYVNSHGFLWESPCYRLCDFFKQFDIDNLSLLAVSCLQLIENIYAEKTELFDELAGETVFMRRSEHPAIDLVEKIRKIRAGMFVPSCIKNLGVQEDWFLRLSVEIGEEDRELFSKCYYSENAPLAKTKQVFAGC